MSAESSFVPRATTENIDVRLEMVVSNPNVALALLDSIPDVLLVVDETLAVSYVNAAGRAAFGMTSLAADTRSAESDVKIVNGLELVHPEDRALVVQQLLEIIGSPGASTTVSFRVHHYEIGGGWKPVEAHASNHLDTPGIHGVVVSFRDLVREARIASNVERLSSALERSSELIILHDHNGNVLFANQSAREFLGYERIARKGWPYTDRLTKLLSTVALPAATAEGSWNGDLQLRSHVGAQRTLAVTVTTDDEGCAVITARDITDRKRVEADLHHRATHDTLTGLPNRAALHSDLSARLDSKQPVALLFFDLDRFKLVNDSLGHHFGDELLMHVTARLQAAAPPGCFLARLGGDEFVAVLTDAPLSSQTNAALTFASSSTLRQVAAAAATRFHEVLRPPIDLGGTLVYVTASIGVALSGEGTSSSDLLRQADLAMFRSKAAGRSRTEFFIESMALEAQRGLVIEGELHNALANGDIFVVYQPVLSISDARLIGFEALTRWNRDGDIIEPSGFLAVAQESELIVRIDSLVLREACVQLKQWSESISGANELTMAVNLSARQLAQPNIVEAVRSALDESGIEPHRLELEITEGSLMTDLKATLLALKGLKSLGVRLAIDDFGTGYSSLAYLQKFGADTVKIDRAFVEGAGNDSNDARIIEAIIGLAQTFNMHTIAEGIETQDQLDRVKELGCDSAQGFMLGRPLNASAATALIETFAPASV